MPEQTPRLGTNPEPASVMGPVRPRERIETIDILRGFALFGILLVNWTIDWQWDPEPQAGSSVVDQVTYWLIKFAAVGKFWPIFSFLFGLGFAIQIERLEARGAQVARLYSRRLLVLFVIGAANFILVGPSDVVYRYAILGFLLLLMRKWPARALPLVAVVFVLLPWAHTTWQGWERERRLANPATAAEAVREVEQRRAENLARWAQWEHTYETGSFEEIVTLRAGIWKRRLFSWDRYDYFFPLLLLGFYVGRRRLFHNVSGNRRFIHRVMWWSLAIGLIGTTASMLLLTGRDAPFLARQLSSLLDRFSSPALAFFYIAGLTLLLEKPLWKRRTQPLAAAGRMTLTNYLLHHVVYLLFFGYGFELSGNVGVFRGAMLTLPVFFMQVLLSTWWLQSFRFGPAEWLWRTLTYGKLQPMRVKQA